jgi:hypothetical protein
VFYFLLTGQSPFNGRDVAEVFSRTLSSNPVADVCVNVSDVPADFGTLISRCLKKEQADRPESIVRVSVELSRIRAELDNAE